MSHAGSPRRWAWDLYPLARGPWPSRQIATDCLPGHTVTLTETEMIVRRVPYVEDSLAWREGQREVVPCTRRRVFYLPTEDDLTTLRRCYPDADPNQPAWTRIEADLIAAGRDVRELPTFKAPTLIRLLDMACLTPTKDHEQAREAVGTTPVEERDDGAQAPSLTQPELHVAVQSSEAEPAEVTKTRPLTGGKIVFHEDRVELCGVDICSGPRSKRYRRTLELLAKTDSNGSLVSYSCEALAEAVGAWAGATDATKRESNAAGLIRHLRARIRQALRDKANLECGDTDVILSGELGYRFPDCLSVQYEDRSRKADITDTDGAGGDPNVHNGDVRNVHNVRNGDVHDDPNAPENTPQRRRAWILQRLEVHRLKAPDVAEHFGRSMKTAHRDLESLKDEGLIEFVGVTRSGYYRLRAVSGTDQ